MSQVMPASDDADNGRLGSSSSSDIVDSQTLHDTVAAVNDALVAAGRTDLVPRFAALVRLLPLHLHQQPPIEQPQQLPQPCPVDAAVTADPPSSRYTEAARLQAGCAVKATDWWTLYPHELQAKILVHAGPLTQLLCGHLDVEEMDDTAKRALWVDAFKQDWQGDIALLPDADLLPRDFAHVSSRSIFHRLWERFPYYNTQHDGDDDQYGGIRVGQCMIPMRHMWLDCLPLMPHEDLAMIAIHGDHAAFLEYMLDKKLVSLEAAEEFGLIASTSRIDHAAFDGSLGVIKVLSARGANATVDAMDDAARNGHLETVKWLHEHRTEGCTTQAMDNAAANGHLDTVKWLHEHRTEGCTTQAMNGASQRGHLEVVQWLHANRREGCTTKAMDNAATYGRLNVVQWLLANRTEGFTFKAIADAANDDIARLLARSLTAEQRTEMAKYSRRRNKPDFKRRLACLLGESDE